MDLSTWQCLSLLSKSFNGCFPPPHGTVGIPPITALWLTNSPISSQSSVSVLFCVHDNIIFLKENHITFFHITFLRPTKEHLTRVVSTTHMTQLKQQHKGLAASLSERRSHAFLTIVRHPNSELLNMGEKL